MNTLTKSFAKRALSILLVTIMIFSLGVVGITSVSAAGNYWIDRTKNVACFNSASNVWNNDNWNDVNMTGNGNGYWEFGITNYQLSRGEILFNFACYFDNYDGGVQYFYPTSNYTWEISDAGDITAYEAENSGTYSENTFRLNFDKLVEDGKSSCDIYIKLENYTYDGVTKIKIWAWVGNIQDAPTAPEAPSSVTAAIQGTYTGSGTESDPYLITPGASYTINFTAVHTDSSVSFTYYLYNNGSASTGNSTSTTWSFTGTAPAAGTDVCVYVYDVYAKKDNVKSATSVDSNKIWVKGYEFVLDASMEITPDNPIEGDNLVITVTDNTNQLENANVTYTLYNGTEVVKTQDTPTFVLTNVAPGTYNYKVYVDAGDHADYTNAKEVIVSPASADNLTLTVDVPASVDAGNDIVINASVDTDLDVVYILYDVEDNVLAESDDGYFNQHTYASDAGSTKTFRVVANVDANTPFALEQVISVKVNEISTTDTIRIYFKSSDSEGYKPLISVTDVSTPRALVRMNMGDVIAVDGASQFNPYQTTYYRWYYYDAKITEALDTITFEITNSYDMDVTYTINDAYGKSAFYFGVENLNNSQEIVDLTDKTELERNWTYNAVNMIYDEAVDGTEEELVATSYSYRIISMGDTNSDGKVNVRDATLLQKNLAKMTDLSSEGQMVADVNSDDKITVKDATAIQKQIAGL